MQYSRLDHVCTYAHCHLHQNIHPVFSLFLTVFIDHSQSLCTVSPAALSDWLIAWSFYYASRLISTVHAPTASSCSPVNFRPRHSKRSADPSLSPFLDWSILIVYFLTYWTFMWLNSEPSTRQLRWCYSTDLWLLALILLVHVFVGALIIHIVFHGRDTK